MGKEDAKLLQKASDIGSVGVRVQWGPFNMAIIGASISLVDSPTYIGLQSNTYELIRDPAATDWRTKEAQIELESVAFRVS